MSAVHKGKASPVPTLACEPRQLDDGALAAVDHILPVAQVKVLVIERLWAAEEFPGDACRTLTVGAAVVRVREVHGASAVGERAEARDVVVALQLPLPATEGQAKQAREDQKEFQPSCGRGAWHRPVARCLVSQHSCPIAHVPTCTGFRYPPTK